MFCNNIKTEGRFVVGGLVLFLSLVTYNHYWVKPEVRVVALRLCNSSGECFTEPIELFLMEFRVIFPVTTGGFCLHVFDVEVQMCVFISI